MTKPYLKGYMVEEKARKYLKSLKPDLLIRSSRSLSIVDLVAVFKEAGEIWLIQCKAGNNPQISKKELEKLKDLEEFYYVKPYLYIKEKGKYVLKEVK
jgi:Holliday junction resolvase